MFLSRFPQSLVEPFLALVDANDYTHDEDQSPDGKDVVGEIERGFGVLWTDSFVGQALTAAILKTPAD